jgi:Fic-DOC domain mobile mystery protein B
VVDNFLFKHRDGQTPLPPDLRNGLKKKHIQTIGELDEFEEQNIASGIAWLNKCRADCTVYTFWLKAHKKLFGDVWDWAGSIRKHELRNPNFLEAHKIWPAFKLLEGDLNYWIHNKTFSLREISARFHERIETIHPFPNGNGRWGRILTEYFCKQFGSEIPTWGKVLGSQPRQRRKTYVDALEQARHLGDYAILIQFMFS